jgi:hypothetical protein
MPWRCMREWMYRSRFLDLGTSWRWVVSFMPRPLYPQEKAPGTHWIGGWVKPRAGLDEMEKRKFLTLLGLELRPLGRPARSESLYRLRYPGSYKIQQYISDLQVFATKYTGNITYTFVLVIRPRFSVTLFSDKCSVTADIKSRIVIVY